MQLTTSVKKFLSQYFAKYHYSKKTIASYSCDLIQFQSFFEVEPSLRGINSDNVENWVLKLKEKKYAPSTIQRKIASLKIFFNYWVRKEKIEKSPMWQLRFNFGKIITLPKTLTIDEIENLLQQAKDNLRDAQEEKVRKPNFKFLSLRNSAIVELMFNTGLRVGEIHKLRIKDVYLIDKSVFVRGKGNRDRLSFILDNNCFQIVSKYLNYRKNIKLSHNRLFINRFHSPLSTQGIANLIKMLSQQAQMNKHITPHMLRHTAATLLLRNGADIRIVQEFLGHASITTTQRYTHVCKEHLLESLKSFHPALNRNQ